MNILRIIMLMIILSVPLSASNVFKWERVGGGMYRAKVECGWLWRYGKLRGGVLTFTPDKECFILIGKYE